MEDNGVKKNITIVKVLMSKVALKENKEEMVVVDLAIKVLVKRESGRPDSGRLNEEVSLVLGSMRWEV